MNTFLLLSNYISLASITSTKVGVMCDPAPVIFIFMLRLMRLALPLPLPVLPLLSDGTDVIRVVVAGFDRPLWL